MKHKQTFWLARDKRKDRENSYQLNKYETDDVPEMDERNGSWTGLEFVSYFCLEDFNNLSDPDLHLRPGGIMRVTIRRTKRGLEMIPAKGKSK